jgi:F-box protein 3
MVNTFLLPLEQAILETSYINNHFKPNLSGKRSMNLVVVASSHTQAEKFFFLHCDNRQLYVGSRHLMRNKEMFPCVPESLLVSHEHNDALLLWLEEHVHRLETGYIKIREEKKVKSISQFPEHAPLCSAAVTNGVQVRASACFVPEFSCYAELYFCYSIRMCLVPEGCTVNGMKFDSCQLHWRRWLIRSKEDVESDVNGEAVIGEYPLLRPGDKEFVYQSSTPLSVCPGSVEGSFTFVPGKLVDPKGAPFEVEVARFPLLYLDYKY